MGINDEPGKNLSNVEKQVPKDKVEKLNNTNVEGQVPKDKVEKLEITGAIKDPEVAGAIIIQAKDEAGDIIRYSFRKDNGGNITATIMWGSDYLSKTHGARTLGKSEFEKLRKNGVLQAYETAVATEKVESSFQ